MLVVILWRFLPSSFPEEPFLYPIDMKRFSVWLAALLKRIVTYFEINVLRLNFRLLSCGQFFLSDFCKITRLDLKFHVLLYIHQLLRYHFYPLVPLEVFLKNCHQNMTFSTFFQERSFNFFSVVQSNLLAWKTNPLCMPHVWWVLLLATMKNPIFDRPCFKWCILASVRWNCNINSDSVPLLLGYSVPNSASGGNEPATLTYLLCFLL